MNDKVSKLTVHVYAQSCKENRIGSTLD